MPGTKAARRYAKALFDLAEEQGIAGGVGDELIQLANAFVDPTVVEALAIPALSLKERRDIADRIVTGLSLQPLVGNFLRVLVENDRLGDFSDIGQAYQTLLEQAQGRARAVVRSATPLSQEDMNTLLDAFHHLTQKTVIPTAELDPELLGGVVVEIEGRVYDASLKTQRRRLGDMLAQQL
jgi:F-type H+-transporting ATPase subunit delta